MITRSNLAEQLREYQIRSKYDWASFSFFSSTANVPSRVSLPPVILRVLPLAPKQVDVVVSVIWELLIFAFLVFSGVSLYFKYMRLAFLLICITTLLLVCMKITKQVRQNRKSKRRMLLPLSM